MFIEGQYRTSLVVVNINYFILISVKELNMFTKHELETLVAVFLILSVWCILIVKTTVSLVYLSVFEF